MRAFSILICVTMIVVSEMEAQTLSSESFTTENGLPGNDVYDLLLDREGFVWGGTDGGIFRFDGETFETFSINDGLCDNTILKIYQDRFDRVWMAGFNGSVCYYDHGKISSIAANDELQRNIKGQFVTSMGIDDNGTLILGTPQNRYEISPAENFKHVKTLGESLEHLPEHHSLFILQKLSDGKIVCSHQSNSLSAKIGTSSFEFVFNEFKFEWQYPKNDPFNGMLKSIIQDCLITPQGHYLLAMGNMIFEFDKNGILYQHAFEKLVTSLHIVGDKIWVGVFDAGIFIYDPVAQKTTGSPIYSEKGITSLTEDSEHGIWVGTTGMGLKHLPNKSILYFNNELSESKVVAMMRDGNDLMLLNSTSDVISLNDNFESNIVLASPIKASIEIGELIKADNQLLIASHNTQSLNRKTGESKQITHTGFGISTTDITVYDNSYICLAYNKLIKVNDQSSAEYALPYRGRSTIKLNDNRFLVGTLNGLFELQDKSFVEIAPNLFSGQRINFLIQQDSILIAATAGKGVIWYNLKHGTGGKISEEDGLISNICQHLVMHDDELWISSKKGLTLISFKTFPSEIDKIINFDASDGLPGNEVHSIYFDKKGLWVSARNGLTLVTDVKSLINDKRPDIYLREIYVNTKITPIAGEICLNYKENNIEFHFNNNAYRNDNGPRFIYQLKGYNDEYLYSKSGHINFENLPAGQYELEVFAINNQNLRSTKPITIAFEIQPPFWATWWFYSLFILSIIAAVILIIRWRSRRIRAIEKQKSEIQRLLSDSRLQAVRAQMNPHFLFNAINSIQKFILENNSEEAYHYLTRFSRFIRMILEYSKENFITLEHELEILKLYLELEQLRFENKFEYTIHIDPELDKTQYQLPTMLLQPILENAIWHGIMPLKGKRNGIISIEFSKTQEGSEIIIRDNGVGRDYHVEKTAVAGKKSLGLKLIQERLLLVYPEAQISMHDEHVKFESGTRVNIVINKNNQTPDE